MSDPTPKWPGWQHISTEDDLDDKYQKARTQLEPFVEAGLTNVTRRYNYDPFAYDYVNGWLGEFFKNAIEHEIPGAELAKRTTAILIGGIRREQFAAKFGNQLANHVINFTQVLLQTIPDEEERQEHAKRSAEDFWRFHEGDCDPVILEDLVADTRNRFELGRGSFNSPYYLTMHEVQKRLRE